MTTTQPLAPIHACPWCNPDHAGLAPRVNTANGTQHWVFCPECGMHGPCGIGEAEAVERWNIVCSRTPSVLPGAGREEQKPIAWAIEFCGELADLCRTKEEAEHLEAYRDNKYKYGDMRRVVPLYSSPPSSAQVGTPKCKCSTIGVDGQPCPIHDSMPAPDRLSRASTVQAEPIAWAINPSATRKDLPIEHHVIVWNNADHTEEQKQSCREVGIPLYAAPIQAPGIVAEMEKLVTKWRAHGQQPHDDYYAGVWDSLMDCANELSSLIKAVGEKP